MAESKNKVINHFEAKDKNLVNHLKKLDKISKQLTATQKKITNVEKKKTQSTNKYENAVNKLRIQLQLEKKDLKDVKGALDLKTQALRGDELALAKLRRSTKKYIQDLKRQKKGILDTAHGQRILGGSFAVLRSKMLLASFAASIVGMSIGKLVRVFGEQEKAEKGLSDQLGHVNRGLLEQASALQSVTVHGDETLLEVMRFASVLGISEQSLGKTTEQAIGLSKALRVDLMMATRMLANAQVGNTEILNRDIFSSKHSQFLFEKVEMELRSFSMYYQIKGLIQSTDYEYAKNKVIEDTGMEERTFENLMSRGQMLEAMVIFPRVAEYCAKIFEINLDTDSEEIDEIYKNMFGKEEDNDES